MKVKQTAFFNFCINNKETSKAKKLIKKTKKIKTIEF